MVRLWRRRRSLNPLKARSDRNPRRKQSDKRIDWQIGVGGEGGAGCVGVVSTA